MVRSIQSSSSLLRNQKDESHCTVMSGHEGQHFRNGQRVDAERRQGDRAGLDFSHDTEPVNARENTSFASSSSRCVGRTMQVIPECVPMNALYNVMSTIA